MMLLLRPRPPAVGRAAPVPRTRRCGGAGVGGGRGVAGAGAGETGPAGQGAMGAGGLMNDVNVVRILNVLDPNPQPTMVEQMQAVDTSMLEGIPGSLFDWRKYFSSSFFFMCILPQSFFILLFAF